MEIRRAKIVAPRRVFRVVGVSDEYGNRILAGLQAKGSIEPHETTSGRKTLSFEDAEFLAGVLVK